MSQRAFAGAAQISRAVREGEATACGIARRALRRIEAYDPLVGAFAEVDPAEVLARAEAVDAGGGCGRLAGATLAVSEALATREAPAPGAGRPTPGTTCVDLLRGHGAVLLGRTRVSGPAGDGPTRNPHALDRLSGGISSGAAAAVAAGFCALALGLQNAGCTIVPASFCGVWGWKPTWNAVATEGLGGGSPSCDTLGIFSGRSADLGLLADLFEMDPLLGPAPDRLGGLRIGLCRGPLPDRVRPPMREAFDDAARRLRLEGAEVIELRLPGLFEGLETAHARILARESRAARLNRKMAEHVASEDDRGARAGGLGPSEMRAAYALADRCRSEFEELATGFDAVMTPSACDEAPSGPEDPGDAAMNAIWTLLHVPVVSVPGMTGPHGLPLGMSIITPRYTDRMTIAVASLVGEVLGLEAAMA
ncbi:amidase family protein [Allosediminivita pacifica]|uniref:Asp-tRNA(Asn)/Glu-tRNA(Gln) amidotransferase A subunit family amidase n=1 Tax=Allosediminivita pacifica TaxID=1267769 RepID=A0A2T6ATS3_9RHOB|nr:amidase [Allosediminivita pacifica]PTX47220.1 Asp-tRNA(Asn)/Glu-tRNA(Gln) amidotransferase A subunit family amidase [Allosediminivita pacifica]GGB09322.1 amidase [Allosediminivita pacifica]